MIKTTHIFVKYKTRPAVQSIATVNRINLRFNVSLAVTYSHYHSSTVTTHCFNWHVSPDIPASVF